MQAVLANRYRLERQLGKGGMGSVWLAEHLALRSWVAVKLMDPAIAATPEGAERFRREAQAAASLRSAHVVQVLDYGVHEATPFLVMELLQGESLAGCLEREKRLTPERTLSIVTQVARALGRAHAAGIVHRDLKPDNIFLVKEDDQELVKILDFGIAKTPQSTFGGMETRTGVTMGTPYYMSPEQVEGKRAVDFRTDLWAMAVITCECMTGVRPFDGSTFGELLLNICARPIAPPSSQGLTLPGFDAWFAKATSRDAEQRFTSAQELVATLGDVVRGAGGRTFAAPLPASGAPATAPYAPATSAGHSAPSVNTAQALELGTRSNSRSALPWIVLGLVITLASAGAAFLLLRPSSGATAPEASAGPAAAHAPITSAAVALAPAAASSPAEPHADKPSATRPPATGSVATASPAAPASPGAASPAAASPAAASPAAASPTAASPTAASPARPASPALPPAAAATAPATPAAKVSRCFADPFSGQVRLDSAARPANGVTFACKQDPFTGKYKRL